MLVNITDYKNIARNVQYQNRVGCYVLANRYEDQTASKVIAKLYSELLFFNKFISRLYMFRAHEFIIRRSKLYYTTSGIITPIGDRPVHRLRVDFLNLCTGRPPKDTTIPDAV